MAGKTGAKTPKLIQEYRKERERIRRRVKAISQRGFKINENFVPEIINPKEFKTPADWGRLRKEINRLKEITPNVIYKSATWENPITHAVTTGYEGRTYLARRAGRMAYNTRKNNARREREYYRDLFEEHYEESQEEKLNNRIQQIIADQTARDEARLADKLRYEEEEAVRVYNQRNEMMDMYKDNLERLAEYGVSANKDDFNMIEWIDKQIAELEKKGIALDAQTMSGLYRDAQKIEGLLSQNSIYELTLKKILNKDIKEEIIKRDILSIEEPSVGQDSEDQWEDIDEDFYGEDEDEPLTGWHDESYDEEDEEDEEYEPIENQRRKFKRPKETPLEEARGGDEYSSEWMSVTWDVFQYISDKIEAAFNNNKGGFVRRKGSGGKHNPKTEYNFEPDKQALLTLWRNTVDRYSETKNTMKQLIDHIEANEGRINEILQDIEWYIDQASYESGYTELANILNVHPLTLAEAQELEEDRY